MALNENIVIKLMADSTDYTAKMQAASASATQLSTALERPMSTSERLGSIAQKAGLGVGALSLAVGVAAVKAFADFDQSMSAVKTNTGATGAELDQLKQAALDAGAKTVFSATESADAINELAKAGVSTKDILSGGLQGALDLAASGQMGVADAAELTASALNEFGLKGNQASHVADLLAAGAATAQGGVGDMGEALKMVGVTASQTGMSIEDTTGALTMLASKGITGSDAGTQLRSALIGLTSASGPAKKMMQELGISMYDSSGQFVGLADFAGQLKDKLSKLTPEQRANAMGVLFSNAAMSVGNTLYEQGAEGVNKFTKQVNQQGFAAKQAADLTDNLKGDVEQFGGAVETSLIKIGSGANGPIRAVVQNVTNLVTAFGNLPAPVQQTVVMLGLASGAAAGLHKMLGPLSESTSGLARTASLVFDPVQRLQRAFADFSASRESFKLSTATYEEQLTRVGVAASAPTMRMNGMKSAGRGIVDLLGGPWGIAFMAAGVAVSALAQVQADGQKRADSYADALKNGTSAVSQIQENIAKNQNIDWSWWDRQQTGAQHFSEALKDAGISIKTFAGAAAGNKAALDDYNRQMDKLKLGNSDQVTLGQHVNKIFEQQKSAINDAKLSAHQQTEVEKQATNEKAKAAVATAGLTDATKKDSDASKQAADSKEILSTAFGATTKGISNQAAALGEVVDALKTYYGFNLSAFDADTKWGKAINDADKALKENGKTLDAYTPKGQANRDALKGLAEAAQSSAEAHARNGEGVEKVTQVMKQGREQVVKYAKAMGKTPEEADAFADSIGLSANNVQDLVDKVERANATPIKIKDEASKTLKSVKLEAKGLPDGKTIQITGKNKDAMMAIHEVTGAKIDDKHSKLTLDKHQYDMALALANGATIDTKTGQLKGDNSDHWKKIAQSNGWKMAPHTGLLSGDDGPFQATKRAVDNAKIAGKTVDVNANPNPFHNVMNKILRSVFHVDIDIGGREKRAAGGLITGPGTGTSDDIPAMLSNGEYVIRADAVRQYGTEMLNAINWQRYATGGYVQKYEATPVTPNVVSALPGTRIVYEQPVTFHQHVVRDPTAQAALDAAKVRHLTAGLLRRGGLL